MRLHAFTVNLVDDASKMAAYRTYHKNPWPEVTKALSEVGLEDLRIWQLGRRLFMLAMASDDFDPATDLPAYLDLDPRCVEWEDLMTTLQEPVKEAAPGEKWAPMEEIFVLSQHVGGV